MSRPSSPLVSVVISTFNHERYIAQAMESVLSQSLKDLELIIVNDGSTDSTEKMIRSYSDPRISYMAQAQRGPSVGLNRGIAASRGKYIALMSSDDICYPHRLERQVEEAKKRKGRVLFSHVTVIDDAGNEMPAPPWLEGLFNTDNLSRAEILNRFLKAGNFLNAVTAFAERAIFQSVSSGSSQPHHPLLLQYQDFELWLRLAKRYDFGIIGEPLVKYRVRGDQGNISIPTPSRSRRTRIENYLIGKTFFDGVDGTLFRSAFSTDLVRPDFSGETEMKCEQAFLLTKSEHAYLKLSGVEWLERLFLDPSAHAVLKEKYAFNELRFFELLGKMEIFVSRVSTVATLFVDVAGKGFCFQNSVAGVATLDEPEFRITYDLSGFGPVSELRWDPAENVFCRVTLASVSYQEASGAEHSVDLSTIRSNGIEEPTGATKFLGLDPSFYFPVQGKISTITIAGTWSEIGKGEMAAHLCAASQDKSSSDLMEWLRAMPAGRVKGILKGLRRLRAGAS